MHKTTSASKLFGIIILCLMAPLTTRAQKTDSAFINTIAKKIKAYTNYSEKVYLHFDKPYYAAGDTVYFKAYVTTINNLPSDSSGILHVELTCNGKLQSAIKLPLADGVAWGDITLPDTLKQNNYELRAYTNLMRNQSADDMFVKTLPIGNGIAASVFAKATYTPDAVNKQLVNTTINYATIEGKPYISREVNYQVQTGDGTTKGKGTTNINGDITFSFTKPATPGSVIITARIRVNASLTVTKTFTIKPAADTYNVQFFAEGGDMINGLRSKVAFKALGSNGLGVAVNGSVFDDTGTEVAKITTRHAGMGAIFITPQAGRTYTAKLNYPDGSTGSVPLPAAKADGYVLGVFNNPADTNIIVKIAASTATFQRDQNMPITLVAQSGSYLIYAAKSKLEAAVFTASIPASQFPTGIARFTLFSATGEPLNERVIFIQNPPKLKLVVNTAKASYAAREKVSLWVFAKTADQSNATGSYSIAVTDETKVPVDDDGENSIVANLLLTSDIKGYIEKPNYYFNNVTDSTKANLDLLMLTQGYRRFSWQQVLANTHPAQTFKPERGIDITGQVKKFSGKPVPGARVLLTSRSQGIFMADSITNKEGRFAFRNVVFADSLQFFITATNAKGEKDVDITLDQPLPGPAVKKTAPNSLEVNSAMEAYLLNSKKQYDSFLKYGLIKKSTFLKEVAITDKRPELRHTDNLNTPGRYDAVIKSDKLLNYGRLIDVMYNALPGIYVSRDHRVYARQGASQPMVIMLDGTPMIDTKESPFTLDDINVGDVASIEILRNMAYTAVYGQNGRNGILVITTKQTPQDYADAWGKQDKSTPGILSFTGMGYHKAREFYSPAYDDPKTNKNVADLRTTIYWQPDITFDKNNNALLQFFNADSPGTYKAVVEGIDADGNIARQVYRYKVE